nr:MAG TPA: hypothetical protein [Caudoviricetes sp.]
MVPPRQWCDRLTSISIAGVGEGRKRVGAT